MSQRTKTKTSFFAHNLIHEKWIDLYVKPEPKWSSAHFTHHRIHLCNENASFLWYLSVCMVYLFVCLSVTYLSLTHNWKMVERLHSMEVYIWTREEEVTVAPWLCTDGLVCCRVNLHLYRGDKSLHLVRLSVCLSRVYDMLEIGKP